MESKYLHSNGTAKQVAQPCYTQKMITQSSFQNYYYYLMVSHAHGCCRLNSKCSPTESITVSIL